MNNSDHRFTPFLKIPTIAVFAVACHGAMLSGCSTHSAAMRAQVEQQTSDQKLIEQVTEALEATEARFAKAQAKGVDVYAPSQMSNARRALDEARRYAERFQADPGLASQSNSLFFGDTLGKDALSLLAKANDALNLAEENKQQADVIFAAANENFEWLKKFHAPTYYRYEYEDLTRTHQQLVEYVASGEMDAAQHRLPAFLSEQRALEIIAAQRFYLYDLDRRIGREGRAHLERYAPISYTSSAGALNKAKAVIAQNPRAEEQILAAKKNAEFSFEVANAVATDMQQLSTMDRQEMERWLILLTSKLHDMGVAVGAEDVRNKEVMQQLDLLAEVAAGKGQPTKQDEQLATAEPEAKAEEVAAAADPAAQADEQAIDHRMTQLEQSLAEQIKALSAQIDAMKEVSVSAQAAPAAEVTVEGN